MSSDQTAVIRGCISHKLLSPGFNKLFVSYYRQKVFADVLENGTMRFQGKIYVNVTALALAMKRTLNPTIKTDPGWMSLFATDSNTCLKDIREQWIEKITPPPPTSSSSTASSQFASSFMKPSVIRPKQPYQSQPHAAAAAAPFASSLAGAPREICQACKRDRGPHHVACDACRKSFHIACLTPTSLKPSTTPWYCEGCIQKHCAMVLKFLYDLRHVAKHFDVLPAAASPVDAAAEEGEGSATAAESRADPEAAAAVEATVAPPATLLAQVDGLIDQLESPATRMNVLANSTGELLVHLSQLDVAAGLRTLDDQLHAIAAACSRDNEPRENGMVSPGVEGILKVLNLRHGIMSARFHAKRTTAALTTLSEKRIRSFVKTQTKLDDAFQKELKVYNDWAGRVKDAEADVASQHTHITHVNALVDNAVRHRKTLRAASLKHRFIPAYRAATEDLSVSSDHLLITIVADKLKGLAASLKEWESVQGHFEAMRELLISQKTNGHLPLDAATPTKEPADAAERPLKLLKLEMELPRPPSLKLVDRQLQEVARNLASVQNHKTKALKTLSTIQTSFTNRLRPPLSDEWQALMATMDEMVRKCLPPPPPPVVADTPAASGVVEPAAVDGSSNDLPAVVETSKTADGGGQDNDTNSAGDNDQVGPEVEVEDEVEDTVSEKQDADGPDVVSLDGDDDEDEAGDDAGHDAGHDTGDDEVEVLEVDDDDDDDDDEDYEHDES